MNTNLHDKVASCGGALEIVIYGPDHKICYCLSNLNFIRPMLYNATNMWF